MEHNVFRGQVLSFGREVFGHGEALLTFQPRPTVGADQLILAPATLAEVHRQVVEVARHKERLLAAGQHLERGVLLYGPPDVRKTHTVRYLMSSPVDTTVVQLTGGALQLVAEDRGMHPGAHPPLFQLLDEMDGLADDATSSSC